MNTKTPPAAASTRHTPEPWTCCLHDDPVWRIGPDAKGLNIVAITSQRNDAANAARIVACVNACCGMADPAAEIAALRGALKPLAAIADAYDDNRLDDEARKFWGENNEHQNQKDPACLELYNTRGGGRLLTLAHCFAARAALGGKAVQS